jgi:hypothetical protein
MHYPLLADLLIKSIIEMLSKIPIINIVTGIIVFLFLFTLGIQYLSIALRTHSIQEVNVLRYSIFTRWAIKQALPKTNKNYGLFRFMITIVGIAFIITPIIVCVVEINRTIG